MFCIVLYIVATAIKKYVPTACRIFLNLRMILNLLLYPLFELCWKCTLFVIEPSQCIQKLVEVQQPGVCVCVCLHGCLCAYMFVCAGSVALHVMSLKPTQAKKENWPFKTPLMVLVPVQLEIYVYDMISISLKCVCVCVCMHTCVHSCMGVRMCVFSISN